MRIAMILFSLAAMAAGGAQAAPAAHPQAEAQALDLAKKAIALRSVAGPGNQTPAGRGIIQRRAGRGRLRGD